MIEVFYSAGIYVLKISGIIAASLFLAEFLSRAGLFGKLSFMAKPISCLSNLGPKSSSALITSFLSPTAASVMLRDFYERGDIKKRELFIASIARALPIILLESRYILPVIVPVLGVVGLMYYLIWVGINAMVTLSSFLLGKVFLPKPEGLAKPEAKGLPLKEAARESFKGFRKPLFKILIIFVPAVFASFIFSGLGFFNFLALKLSSFSHLLPFPPQGLAVVAAYAVSPIASYPIAGRLLSEGVLLPNEVILCFLSGYIIALPYNLRAFLPHYIGIYGLRDGLQLMAASICLRSVFVLSAIGILTGV